MAHCTQTVKQPIDSRYCVACNRKHHPNDYACLTHSKLKSENEREFWQAVKDFRDAPPASRVPRPKRVYKNSETELRKLARDLGLLS